MEKLELRAEMRVSITHRGTLHPSIEPFPCLIQDFSTKGFLIMSTVKVQIGEILELRCELYPGRFLQCYVEVRHINGDCVGTKIVDMSDDGLKLCREFINEHFSLNRFG